MSTRVCLVLCTWMALSVMWTRPASAQTCYSESFDSFSNGTLPGQNGWSGQTRADTTPNLPLDIDVQNGVIRISADGTAAVEQADFSVDCPPCEDGTITVTFKIQGGLGTGTLWGIYFDDADDANLARFYGTSTNIRGRAGGAALGYLTEVANLTGPGTWDEAKVVIDTAANQATYYLNNVLLPANPPNFVNPVSHGVDGAVANNAGNTLSRIRIERQAVTATTGDLLIDDIQITACPGACSALVTPKAAQVAYAESDGAATPASFEYTLLNNNQDTLSLTAAEVNADGSPTDYPWLLLSETDPIELTAGVSDTVTASLNATGLAGGLYIGYIQFTSNCPSPTTYTRVIKLMVDDCFTEHFSYADGRLDLAPGWSGRPVGVAHPIQVQGGAVQITGGSWGALGSTQSIDVVHDVPDGCPACGLGRQISAKARVQAGTGDVNMWSLYFDGELGANFGRWMGSGTTVRGRIDGTDLVTDVVNLSGPGTWDELEIIIDTVANTTRFLVNGVDKGQFFHDPPDNLEDPGDSVEQIRIERLHNAEAQGHTVMLDDVSLTRCIRVCPDPVFDLRDETSQETQDGKVTAQDLVAFEECATGPAPGPSVFEALSFNCRCLDVTGDSAIDQSDFGWFQRCYSGSVAAADPACDD